MRPYSLTILWKLLLSFYLHYRCPGLIIKKIFDSKNSDIIAPPHYGGSGSEFTMIIQQGLFDCMKLPILLKQL